MGKDMTGSDPPFEDVNELIRELTAAQKDSSRRGTDRQPHSLSLMVQPLDLDFQPVGDPFRALSRDISDSGVGFLNLEAVPYEFVRVSLVDFNASMVARVRHCSSLGKDHPLYLVGLEFIEGQP